MPSLTVTGPVAVLDVLAALLDRTPSADFEWVQKSVTGRKSPSPNRWEWVGEGGPKRKVRYSKSKPGTGRKPTIRAAHPARETPEELLEELISRGPADMAEGDLHALAESLATEYTRDELRALGKKMGWKAGAKIKDQLALDIVEQARKYVESTPLLRAGKSAKLADLTPSTPTTSPVALTKSDYSEDMASWRKTAVLHGQPLTAEDEEYMVDRASVLAREHGKAIPDAEEFGMAYRERRRKGEEAKAPEAPDAVPEAPAPIDPAKMTQEEIAAAVDAGPNNLFVSRHVEDWGKRPRGQGKRSGYMVRGAMADPPQGKKAYLDIAGKLPAEERADYDSLEDMGPARLTYLKARGAGFAHDFAMDYALEKSGELPPGEAKRRSTADLAPATPPTPAPDQPGFTGTITDSLGRKITYVDGERVAGEGTEAATAPVTPEEALARKWKRNEDGTYTAPNGVIWRKAAAGGEHSPITGDFFQGGWLMPIHGMAPKAPKSVGEGNDPGRPSHTESKSKEKDRPSRSSGLSPEEQRLRAEEQRKWNEIASSPLARLHWVGNAPNSKAFDPGSRNVNLKSWREYAEEIGPEGVQAIVSVLEPLLHAAVDADLAQARQAREAKKAAGQWNKDFDTDISPDAEQWFKEEVVRRADDAVGFLRGGKGHEKKVPGSHYARELLFEMLEPANHPDMSPIDAYRFLGQLLAEPRFTGTITDSLGRKITYVDGQRVAGEDENAGAGNSVAPLDNASQPDTLPPEVENTGAGEKGKAMDSNKTARAESVSRLDAPGGPKHRTWKLMAHDLFHSWEWNSDEFGDAMDDTGLTDDLLALSNRTPTASEWRAFVQKAEQAGFDPQLVEASRKAIDHFDAPPAPAVPSAPTPTPVGDRALSEITKEFAAVQARHANAQSKEEKDRWAARAREIKDSLAAALPPLDSEAASKRREAFVRSMVGTIAAERNELQIIEANAQGRPWLNNKLEEQRKLLDQYVRGLDRAGQITDTNWWASLGNQDNHNIALGLAGDHFDAPAAPAVPSAPVPAPAPVSATPAHKVAKGTLKRNGQAIQVSAGEMDRIKKSGAKVLEFEGRTYKLTGWGNTFKANGFLNVYAYVEEAGAASPPPVPPAGHGRTPLPGGQPRTFTMHEATRSVGEVFRGKDGGMWLVTESSPPKHVSSGFIDDTDAWDQYPAGAGRYGTYTAIPVEETDAERQARELAASRDAAILAQRASQQQAVADAWKPFATLPTFERLPGGLDAGKLKWQDIGKDNAGAVLSVATLPSGETVGRRVWSAFDDQRTTYHVPENVASQHAHRSGLESRLWHLISAYTYPGPLLQQDGLTPEQAVEEMEQKAAEYQQAYGSLPPGMTPKMFTAAREWLAANKR